MNTPIAFVADGHYPAVRRLLGEDNVSGKVLDVPAGQGAFALELIKHGFSDIHCLDLTDDGFNISEVKFDIYNANDPLPFPDNSFDYVFSVEGIEHFDSPFVFIMELGRVLKPGGKMYITTPNTFSVDARLKYLLSGYYPRFKPLMQEPHRLLKDGDIRDTHVAPIYFWQLNYFLLRADLRITQITTNAISKRGKWIQRVIENFIAKLIRKNIKKRGFPDNGITSDEVLFGDCIVIEATKGKE